MSVLDRVNAAFAQTLAPRAPTGARKAFTEPPFWSLDAMRLPLLGSLPDRERIEHSFEGYARAGKGVSVVFACHYARLRHYAQAVFKWERLSTRELFGDTDLSVLERPWPTGTTGDMLAWMEVDATYAGNSYWTFVDDEGRYGRQATGPSKRLARMRPDWVWILLGSKSGDPYALDARIIGFVYQPQAVAGTLTGRGLDRESVLLTPAEVAHYAPVPDPDARFRGMSWLSPAIREIQADRAATEHKLKFFESGASLQTIVSLDKDISTPAFDEFVERFRASYEGTGNAYSTLFVGGGADVTVTSADLQKLDYKAVQGGGETRVAAAAGVHPVVVGLSEGLQGSSLNAGNYKAAMRAFGDGTLTHLWQVTCSSLQNLVRPPAGTRLWIDKPAIAFMQDDAKDLAEVQFRQGQTFRTLVDAGMDPDAAIAFLQSNDLSKMSSQHSGLFSVQLQKPGSQEPSSAATNGSEVPGDLRKLLAGAGR